MPIYLFVPLSKNIGTLTAAIEAKVAPPDRHRLQNEAGWLVKFSGTTVEVSNFVGVTGQPVGQPGPLGPCLVVLMSGYFGRGPTDMWEWIKTRIESS